MQYAMTQPEIADVVNGDPMKATIDVQDRTEADRIKAALGDEQTRALINILGALAPFSRPTQQRILAFVRDHFAEVENAPQER